MENEGERYQGGRRGRRIAQKEREGRERRERPTLRERRQRERWSPRDHPLSAVMSLSVIV